MAASHILKTNFATCNDGFAVAIAEHATRAWVNGEVVSTGAEILRWGKTQIPRSEWRADRPW